MIIKIAILSLIIVFSFSDASASISDELDRAESLIESGDYTEANPILKKCLEELLRENKSDSKEGVRVARLQALAETWQDEKVPHSLIMAQRVLEKAQKVLSVDDDEIVFCKMTLAEALLQNNKIEESKKLWREAGSAWMKRNEGKPSRDAADCLVGLARTLRRTGTGYTFDFNGNWENPIRNQIVIEEVPTPDANEAATLFQKAIEMHRSLGGPDDLEAKNVERNLQSQKWEIEKQIEEEKTKAAQEIIKELALKAHAEAIKKLRDWKKLHPAANVVICASGEAECYHLSLCPTIDNCRQTHTTNFKAKYSYRRRPCLVCDPPVAPTLPENLTSYRFDGKMVPLSKQELRKELFD